MGQALGSVRASRLAARQRRSGTAGQAQALPRRHLDEEQFARDLSLMLRSGLGVMEALQTVREQAHGAAAQALDQLAGRLQQGEALSGAMQRSGGFGTALVACVKASELTGDLGESLQRYAANAERLRVMRTKLVSALVYPALLIGVALLVVMFLLGYVVPRFALVLQSTQQEMPLASRALVAIGQLLHGVPWQLWAGLALLAGLGGVQLWRLSRSGRLTALAVRLGARLPWLGDLVRAFGRGQFARSGAMLVRSGVPALRAMQMCRELLSPADRHGLDRALQQAGTGAPLAAALHQQGLLDALGLRVLRVAEQTGALDLALDRLADVHDARLERQLERAGRLIEPLVMLFIGLVVGGIVVLMYLPIFQLASSLQ